MSEDNPKKFVVAIAAEDARNISESPGLQKTHFSGGLEWMIRIHRGKNNLIAITIDCQSPASAAPPTLQMVVDMVPVSLESACSAVFTYPRIKTRELMDGYTFATYFCRDGCCHIRVVWWHILPPKPIPTPPTPTHTALVALWHADTATDVRLCCLNNEELSTHALILIARMSVFATMLPSGFRESSTRMIPCAFTKPAMHALLTYVYTGECPAIPGDLALEVVAAAHFYQLDDLCAFASAVPLTDENVVPMLQLAVRCEIATLREAAMDYIWLHMDQLSEELLATLDTTLLVHIVRSKRKR